MRLVREFLSRRSSRFRNGFDPINYAAVRWATDTFQNSTSDGDYSNFLNYDTLSTPTASDDMVLGAVGTSGNVSCLGLTDNSGVGTNYIGGGQITIYGTATAVTVNGGTIAAGSPAATFNGGNFEGGLFSGTLTVVGTYFTADPGASCTLNCSTVTNFAANVSSAINDDGTAQWGAFTFTGTVTATGAGIGCSASSIFNGSVTSTAVTGSGAVTFNTSLTCSNVNAPNITTVGPTQTGAGVNLVVGLLTSAATWTSVTAIGTVGLNCIASASQSGNAVSYVLTGGGGTVSLTLPAVPNPNDVLNTATPAGNWQRPNNESSDAAAAQWIANGRAFGVSGASAGTLPSGGGGIIGG